MGEINFRLSWDPDKQDEPEELLKREWILTNSLGGYASGTLSGIPTRRYHGLLIAALPSPFGRQVFLNHLSELVVLPDKTEAYLAASLKTLHDERVPHFKLREVRLEEGLPIWRYERNDLAIERRIVMLNLQNTVVLRYELIRGDGPVKIELQPSVNFRPHEERPHADNLDEQYSISHCDGRHEIRLSDSKLPPLRLALEAGESHFIEESGQSSFDYREEKNRGYHSEGKLWTPGIFRSTLTRQAPVTLFASTEPWGSIQVHRSNTAFDAERRRRRRMMELPDPSLRSGVAAQLILAADQFVITPAGRIEDAARAFAYGEQPRSVIAGYHWFTDWGRDTMISLEGLTLVTGRITEARWILHTFALHLKNGLIPNLFPEGERQGLYHTADATLWFFHALSRYVELSGDRDFLRLLLPRLVEIVNAHRAGTDFGIGMDPIDNLLRQGENGYQLTWMDAKVDGWVVTPRRGKAVEINALWFNALTLLSRWLIEENQTEFGEELAAIAAVTKASFNRRFWNSNLGYLFDVVDGEDGKDDPALRPNQLLAISLPHAVLDESHWNSVLQVVEAKLLTPFGLRSLAPGHPDYKSTYSGDLRARDAAYHQGTVWSWLIGPYIDALLRVRPDAVEQARSALGGLVEHLTEAGLGTISEVFDAEPPYTPRGCIAQAWGVAELLRSIRLTSANLPPSQR